MPQPKAEYPVGTVFHARIHENEVEKEAVAEYLVDRFLGPGQSAFVSDGSSTFFIGLSLFAKRIDGFRLYTNSLPIAHEYPLWETDDWPREFSLFLAGGKVNPKLMMTGGDSTAQEIETQMTPRAGWTILSTRLTFGDRGPAGREPDSLEIKQAALKAAQRVILIADHTKLSEEYTDSTPLVYAERSEWQDLLKRRTTYVVTTLPPGKTSDEMRALGQQLQSARRNPSAPEEWYAKNTWMLRFEIEERFVEISS